MNLRGCLVLLALLALGRTAGSASGVPTPSLNWRCAPITDGLVENACASVSLGRGSVWVHYLKSKSFGALDGYAITNLPAPGISPSRIYESPGRQLWVVAEDGLRQFKNGAWSHYAVPQIAAELRAHPSANPDRIPLCPVRTGRVLFLLPDALMELDVDSEGKLTISSLRSAADGKLGKFLGMTASERNRKLWITAEHGLAHSTTNAPAINVQTGWDEYPLPESWQLQNVRSPIEDGDIGVTAVAEAVTGGLKSIVHCDLRAERPEWSTNSAGREDVRWAWHGPDKSVWFATGSGLFQFEPDRPDFVSVEDVPAGRYLDVAVEPAGVFWLATSDGLFRYSPPAWRTPVVARNLNSPVQAVTGDAAGTLWAATADSLWSFRGNQAGSHRLPDGLVKGLPAPQGIFAISNGSIVLDAGDRLLQFKPGTGQFAYIDQPQRTRLKPIGLLRDGTLCVQSFSTGPGNESARLLIFDGTKLAEFPYPQPSFATLGNQLFFFASPSGNLWLAGSKAVARFRNQQWSVFSPVTETMPEGVSCLIELSEDRIWCGAQDRIWECDGKIWKIVGVGFGRVNSLVRAVHGDSDKSVWVAAENGLRRFHRNVWRVNGVEEGLPGAVRDVFEDNDGRIWAATARGLSLYHPDADLDPPQTYADNPGGAEGSLLEGSPVTISFHAVDKWNFTPAPLLLYSYRVDEEQNWSPFQETKSVTLPELAPGRHSFQVRSIDRNWNEDQSYRPVEFSIVIPWYKESRLLLISSAGLAVAFFFAALAFNRHRRLVRAYAEVEAKVTLRTKQLEMAGKELLHSQKMNALGTLAAGIAHDFNNILSIIKGSAQIIEDNLENEDKIRTRVSRIKTVVEQGSGIVKAMLGFSRSSSGELGPCEANAVVGETIKLLGDRFLREVEVQFQPAPSLPSATASPDFIQQILLNLIFNAAEAMTEHRQVILSTQQSDTLPNTLVLAPSHAARYVFISVKDFGCGVPPEIMPRIFEPFFTTKSLSARRGTGLGLSMVYELARQMEAGLAAESTLGQGSIFTLILPIRDLPVDAAKPLD